MDRVMKALFASLAAASAGLSGIAAAQQAQAQESPQQLAQAAAESAVITKGTTSAVRVPKPAPGAAAPVAAKAVASPAQAPAVPETQVPAEIGPAMNVIIGKSTLIRLPAALERISVGNPAIADVTLISSKELYLLGKTFGSTNVIMWRRGGGTTIIDVNVNMDSSALEQRLKQLLPEETGIKVHTAADAVVLSGIVSSAVKADYAMTIAEAFGRTYSRGFTLPVTAGDEPVAAGRGIAVGQQVVRPGGTAQGVARVINLMRVAQPQQVMLEVKVAEVSKNLLDKLGVGIDGARVSGSWRYSILSNFLSTGNGVLGMLSNTGNALTLDAEKKDGLIRVLAEPNIVSISGQEASFLAGGKIFIPVARGSTTTGQAAITLEEKEFGVGLKFTPTVLDGGRINLKVAPEVSELSQTGSPFTTVGGATTILPSFTTRRAQTTVQLMDGQSFAIAGLIKNNVTETIKRFPVLGEVPVLGALFRSNEFQTDRSELMFVITPRLVKPLPGGSIGLPTDNFVPPSRSEFFLNGQLEGSGNPEVPSDRPPAPAAPRPAPAGAAPQPAAAATQPAAPAQQGGFQLK